ncbi:MAG: FkbM family methyltransferase [bacterium]
MLDKKDSMKILIFNEYEKFETKLIRKVIKKGDIVLDLGAMVGYYSVLFSQLVGDNGRVISFEPDPNNIPVLETNLEMNRCKNVTLEKKAVAAKSGKGQLFLCDKNLGMHRIYKSKYCGDSVDIDLVSLDDYFRDKARSIDVIKLDLEGAEFGAIQGMRSVIEANERLVLFTEFVPCYIAEFGVQPKDYLSLLLDLGFTLYNINSKEQEVQPLVLDTFLMIYTADKRKVANLLCVKGEHLNVID